MTPSGVAARREASGSRWVVRFKPRPEARLRLFCLPYAGAGASVFRTWPAGVADDVEVCAVQLPGREGRYSEPLFTDVRALSEALCDGIAPLLDRPFAFFGHSLGALVAYETARALGARRDISPAMLALSGHRAPALPSTHPPIHHLPADAFLDELRRLNGTPAEVFAHAELLDVVVPPLRADLQMAETYVPPPPGDLSCPVLALGSTGDDRVSAAMLEPWRSVTTGPFEVRMLPGDHFYLKSHRADLLAVLTTRLRPFLR